MTDEVLLATLALEPNRWGTVTGARGPTMRLSEWAAAIGAAGFDGIEVWEPHLRDASEDEAEAVFGQPMPLTVWNSYVDLSGPDSDLDALAAWVRRAGSRAVKVNTGSDSDRADADADAMARLVERLEPDVVVLCECHTGTIAEDPAVAAAVLERAGPPERVQAIVHTHEGLEHLRHRLDAYGERITHVHVNHLDPSAQVPPLAEVRAALTERVALLRERAAIRSWTVELVHGLLTPDDRPERTLAQAAADLTVLRAVLADAARG